MTTIGEFQAILARSWGPDSSTLWRPDNPAAGQCGVTALVAQDHLGGAILKSRYGAIWHFYNQIDGDRVDFTDIQFDEPILYDDAHVTRDEAFADTNADQYAALSEAVRSRLLGDGDAD